MPFSHPAPLPLVCDNQLENMSPGPKQVRRSSSSAPRPSKTVSKPLVSLASTSSLSLTPISLTWPVVRYELPQNRPFALTFSTTSLSTSLSSSSSNNATWWKEHEDMSLSEFEDANNDYEDDHNNSTPAPQNYSPAMEVNSPAMNSFAASDDSDIICLPHIPFRSSLPPSPFHGEKCACRVCGLHSKVSKEKEEPSCSFSQAKKVGQFLRRRPAHLLLRPVKLTSVTRPSPNSTVV